MLRDSLLLSLCRKGFPKVADWLQVQWSFIVKSWALAEDAELVWLKFEAGTRGSEHETHNGKENKLK